MKNNKSISLYIIDDHPIFCQSLSKYLSINENFNVIGSSTQGIPVLEEICSIKPDVIIIDIKLNNENGLETAKIIKKKIPKTKVLLLSGYYNPGFVAMAINGGASGFVTKGVSVETIVDAILKITDSDEFYLQKDIDYQMDDLIINNKINPDRKILSEREIEILSMIVMEASTKEISKKFGISEKTVRNHKSNIMKKLNIKNVVGLVKYAYQTGII